MGAAYTHDDVPHQAYLIAHLVLGTINNGTPAPLNPGTLYRLQNPEWFRHLWPAGHCCHAGSGGGQAIREVWYHAHTHNERFRVSLTRDGRHHRDHDQPLSTGSLPHAVMRWYSETSR